MTIIGQVAGPVTITGQVDLAFNPFEKRGKHGEWGAGAELKAHDTASATAKRDAAEHHGLVVPELSPPVADVKEFWGSLSDDDAAVLQDYIGQEGSAAINGALRAGKMPGVGKAEPSDADMLAQMLNPSAASSGPTIDRSAEVPALDRIIASHTVAKTTTLYRGMAMSPALAAQLKPGTVFTDKGFTSTSDSANWAGKFARLRVSGSDPMMGEVPALGGKPAVMDITVPAGSHMAPGDLGIKEYILPRGGSYRVDSISPDGGTYNLTALLPTPQQMIAGATPDNAVDVMRQLIATGMDPKAAGDAVSAQLKSQGKAGQTLQGLKAQGFANDSAGDAARAARLAWTEDEIEVQPPITLAYDPLEQRGPGGEWGAGALLKAHDTASATASRDAKAKIAAEKRHWVGEKPKRGSVIPMPDPDGPGIAQVSAADDGHVRDQAMATAREYPGNPHTVADTLHEHLVPRSELDAIAAAGGDPARVNWLEIAHELIERRGDPLPAQEHAATITGQLDLAATAAVTPGAMKPPGIPVPDSPAAISMFTAHRVNSILHQLAHAVERMQAAKAASGDLRAYHVTHIAEHLGRALDSAHELTVNLREHYPAEAAELEAVKQTVGLAKAVSPTAKAVTTAHLLETTLHELTHASLHAQAMGKDTPDGDEWAFDADHCASHLEGAVEHAGKIWEHLHDNYPAESKWLTGIAEITHPGEAQQHAGTISGQLDLASINGHHVPHTAVHDTERPEAPARSQTGQPARPAPPSPRTTARTPPARAAHEMSLSLMKTACTKSSGCVSVNCASASPAVSAGTG